MKLFQIRNIPFQNYLKKLCQGIEIGGKFEIKNGSTGEYKWGKIISNIDETDYNKKVLKVTSHGGWSMMDYYVDTIE